MEHEQYLAAIRSEGHALAGAARTAGVDAPVVSCGDWMVADLLAHLGRIHRWVTSIVVERPSDPGSHWSQHEPPPPDELLDWFDAGVDPLADALADAGPDAEVWTWSADRTSGFWARRQAHETAVHRWDAQGAAGATAPIDRELAVDGIQEYFDILTIRFKSGELDGNGETIHLHCTDGEGEWLVRRAPDALVVTREHAKGDVAARGPASDLLLLLYGRTALDAVEVLGDRAVLETWREAARF